MAIKVVGSGSHSKSSHLNPVSISHTSRAAAFPLGDSETVMAYSFRHRLLVAGDVRRMSKGCPAGGFILYQTCYSTNEFQSFKQMSRKHLRPSAWAGMACEHDMPSYRAPPRFPAPAARLYPFTH